MGGEQAGGTPPSSTESTGRQFLVWHLVVVGGLAGGLGGALSVFVFVPVWVSVVGAFVLVAIFAYQAGKNVGQGERILDVRRLKQKVNFR